MNGESEEESVISLKIDKKMNTAVLSMKGTVDIQYASDLKSKLMDGLKVATKLEIETQSLEELDGATIQLLISARSYANDRERSLEFLSVLPVSVISGMKKLGLSEEQINLLVT